MTSPRRPNLFALDPRLRLEDRFAESLAYLLAVYPDLGQLFLNRLFARAEEKPSIFDRCEARPYAKAKGADKPELLLHARGKTLLIAGRIRGNFRAGQPERLLKLAKKDGHRLVLVTRSPWKVPQTVARSDSYLRPSTLERDAFFWSDFHSIFDRHGAPLSRDFTEWMDLLALRPPAEPGPKGALPES